MTTAPVPQEKKVCIYCKSRTAVGMGEYCSLDCSDKDQESKCAAQAATQIHQAIGQDATGAPSEKEVDKRVEPCLRPGCGKPTFDGRPGEFCSMTCRALSDSPAPEVPLCMEPKCGKPTYNGEPNAFCATHCGDGPNLAVVAEVLPLACLRPGCGKPTWNGKAEEFCSWECRVAGGTSSGAAARPPPPVRISEPAISSDPICIRPGCGKLTWNGKPREFCGRECKAVYASVGPDIPWCDGSGRSGGQSPGTIQFGRSPPPLQSASKSPLTPVCWRHGCGKPAWNGMPGEYCSLQCKEASAHDAARSGSVGGASMSGPPRGPPLGQGGGGGPYGASRV